MAADAKMSALTEKTISQISDLFSTFKNAKRSLELKEIWAEDNLDPSDLASQVKAKDNEQTWGIPIKARVQIVDQVTKQPVGKPTVVQVAKLPKMTSRFSFIVDGGEYQVDHLLKLRSGVYTRVKRNGDLVSEFMLRKGGHKNFDLELDRKRSLIQFTPSRGSSHIPVYPIMKVMGVSDDEMEKLWGKQVFNANRFTSPEAVEKTLKKFYEKTGGTSPNPTQDEVREHVYRYFDDTELLPDTTKVTLGAPFSKVTGGALLAASHKLMKLERKEVEPDDRDSLVFKETVHVEELVPERLFKGRAQITNKVRQGLFKNSVSEIIQGGDLFNRPIREFFTKGGNLSERSEQTNPVQMLSGNFKTTIIAKDYGGIKDAEKLGDEMRTVNPSHFGFLDPMHTPESERTGITLHLGSGVRKDENELKAPVYDLKDGKIRHAGVPEFHSSMVVLPDQVHWKNGKPTPISEVVKVKMPGGDIDHRPFKEAHFVMPTAKGMFSYASNLIPFLPCDQGNRASMADKQIEQAISLKHREAPLVQTVVHPNDPTHTFERMIGHAFSAHRSPVAGRVTKVTPDAIHVHDGAAEHQVQLYNNFPLNDPTTMLHSTPLVGVGDEVKSGQIVADSNYTKNGTLALGTNLRVGYLPYKGYNFEDGIVVSESAAKRLTSEHLHKLRIDVDPEDGDKTDKHAWRAHSSQKALSMSKEQWHALDDDGIVKAGTRVTRGQVLVTALTPNLQKSAEMVKRFGSRAIKPWKDKSLTWDEDFVGTVTRVVKSPNGKTVKIFVKTDEPAEIGDKMAGRHGNKGIITKILPDHEMPFTKGSDGENRPLDVILNPSGVPTRINVGQVLETAAAKIAEKTGKPYTVNNFAGAGHNYREQVLADLKKHGLTDEEMVYDPSDARRPLGSVLVGPQHLLKLKHQVEKKLAVRGGGSDLNDRPYLYDPDKQPIRGGPHGGQGFGSLELYSLLGHNARHNLREMSSYKSDQQNEDFWRMIQEGREPPAPKIPFAYQKFESMLKGMGVDVQKQGTNIRLMPMSDAEIVKMAPRQVVKPDFVVSKTLKPEKGGFFDPNVTGNNGELWSHFKLIEPLPNPIFVGDKQNKGPIPSLLSLKHGDISVEDIDAIMDGKKELNGKIGGHAIRDALKEINVDEAIKQARAEILTKRGSKKDQLNRTLKYLLALKDSGKTADAAYTLSVVPVIPPQFRPMSMTSYGQLAYAKINDLYRNVMIENEKLGRLPAEKFGMLPGQDVRTSLWNGFKALQSVGDYKPIFDKESHDGRELKGFVELIGGGSGEQPKEGFFQSRLIKRKQDLSLRSTIVPEPSLHIDEVGLPRNAAMELYKPFVVAHMTNRYGYRPDEALEHMQKHTEQARKALDEVMGDRPLLLKRDPALHKFSVMAFRPKVVEGKAIKIHPLVTGGFNADFDGDTMAGTVPISREAVEEARKMFPSTNLFSPTTGKAMHIPSQEFMLGLHLISRWGKETGKSYSNLSEMKRAHDKGELAMTDVVNLAGKPTTLGRATIVSGLPQKLALNQKILNDPTYIVKKGTLAELVTHVAKNHPGNFDSVVNHLKDIGTEQSFRHGFSIGLNDFAPLAERDQILAHYQKQADHIRSTVRDPGHRDEKLVEVWQEATAKIDEALKKAPLSNRLATMVQSGARGKSEQLRQMIAAPMLMQDSLGRTVPHPVKRSYAEGLDVGDYWLAQHGARKGTLQRTISTSDPGALTKDIINSTIGTLITSEDCKTKQGISLPLDHPDIHDRYLAMDYGEHKAGSLITPTIVSSLKKVLGPKKMVQVRSPLRCQHGEGICAKCFGLNENGKLHEVGTNIGVLAGQSLGEPATQLAMDAFHSGGVASGRGGGSVSRIERLKQILKMPKTLRGSAVLAKEEGPVESIRPNTGLGGLDVKIKGVLHHVREGEIHPGLKVGDVVSRGQSLSHEGAPVHPKELLGITHDMQSVQRYLTDELYNKLYKGEDVRQRNVELVVRALTNYTRIKDPGSSHWEVGDIVPHSVIEEHNRELKGSKEKPVAHEPILEGSGQIPHLSENWMARLNYQRLGSTLQRAAGMGWKSDLHGAHPIPGIAYGAELGKPPKGSKPYVY